MKIKVVFAVKCIPAKPEDFHFVVDPIDMFLQLINKFQSHVKAFQKKFCPGCVN